jgi:asparagine synthase (glutamine-hydrolysing)
MPGLRLLLALGGRDANERARIAVQSSSVGPAISKHGGYPIVASEGLQLPREISASYQARSCPNQWTIAWDGRLDNRDELADGLALNWEEARSLSDDELALLAYRRWGDGCVRKLLGDWAFAIWDPIRWRLFCAKDPLGWRPVYYFSSHELFALMPDPREFFSSGIAQKRTNHDYLLRFLADALQEPGDTCYGGIYELQGGQSLVVEKGIVNTRTYWRPNVHRNRQANEPWPYVEEFAALFEQAVRARLRGVKHVGVFLSGGLDSSYIAAIAARQGVAVTGITGYAPGTRWMDERDYARSVVRHLGIEQIQVDISDCWSLSDRWLPVETLDQPELAPHAAAHVKLAVAAREAGISTVLGGEGADEWMTADETYVASAILSGHFSAAWRTGAGRRRVRPRPGALARSCYGALVPFAIQDPLTRLRHGRTGTELPPWMPAKSDLVKPGLVSCAKYARPNVWQTDRAREAALRCYRQNAMPIVSWRERHALRPNRIDLRTPFNDLRIVELMASTPEWIKQYNGRRKDLLRSAERAVLPPHIAERDDFGLYTELVERGVSSAERERALSALDSLSAIGGIIAESARQEATDWINTQHRWWEPNWRLITAGLWLQGMDSSVPRAAWRTGVTHILRKEVGA